MRKITGNTYYDFLAQDTVAMIVNDLVTVGAAPQVINAYFAVGHSRWFADIERCRDLVNGWAKACKIAGVLWGGGETPTLTDIIKPDTIDLAGSAIGIIKPKKRLTTGSNLQPSDAIVLIESSGIHANGLTLCRAIAKKLSKGYGTVLAGGTLFGEALLAPTHIYAKLIEDLFHHDITIHYMVNITGHGWRKLMRANRTFTYRLQTVPPIPSVFTFIQKHSRISDREMYATFNMGAGFALYVPQKVVKRVQDIAQKHHFNTWLAGFVEKGPKRVIVEPNGITFRSPDLRIR